MKVEQFFRFAWQLENLHCWKKLSDALITRFFVGDLMFEECV